MPYLSLRRGVLAVIIVSFVVFLLGARGVIDTRALTGVFNTERENGEGYGCTKEARVCADGTMVTRTGEACTFAPCPNNRITDLTPSTTPNNPESEPGESATTPPEDNPAPEDRGTICTMDAKQCPDGSYVGRTGPNCEFICPSPSSRNSSSITVAGVVTVGPTCPVVQNKPDTSCGDKAYEGTILLTNTSNGNTYTAHTDSEGHFTLELTRGVYDVSRPADSNPFPLCGGRVEITSAGSPIPISCDSGIR